MTAGKRRHRPRSQIQDKRECNRNKKVAVELEVKSWGDDLQWSWNFRHREDSAFLRSGPIKEPLHTLSLLPGRLPVIGQLDVEMGFVCRFCLRPVDPQVVSSSRHYPPSAPASRSQLPCAMAPSNKVTPRSSARFTHFCHTCCLRSGTPEITFSVLNPLSVAQAHNPSPMARSLGLHPVSPPACPR